MFFSDMQALLMRYGFDTSDPLALWINAAKNDFASEQNWPFNEVGPVIISMAAGTNSVTLPSDFSRPVSLKDNTNLAMLKYWEQHKFIENIQDETDTGLPEVFTIQARQIQVWRVPTTSINYRLMYQADSPDLVASTDVPQTLSGNVWPEDTHYPIVLNAAFIALMAENEEERAQTAYKQYLDMKMKLMGKYNVLQNADMEATEDTQGYGGADLPIRGIAGW